MAGNSHGWRWLVWGTFFAAWTVALLVPIPDQGALSFLEAKSSERYLLGKGLHVASYAILAAMSGWLRAPMRYRFLLLFGLMAHATGTEVLQEAVKFLGRNGNLLDVGFDHIGIGIGLALTWRWWTAEEA